MTSQQEQAARSVVSDIAYAAISTASQEHGPWNTPVFVAFDDDGNLYWTSSPRSQHSKNIAADARVFLTIFDSTVAPGDGTGVFIGATAEQLEENHDVETARRLLAERAGPGNLESEAFYRARPQKIWINDIETENGQYVRDCRVELPMSVLANGDRR